MMQILYTNAATLPTPQGGRHHGHVGIIMKTKLYTTLTNMVRTNPADPGLYPTIPTNVIMTLQYQLQLQHDEGCRIYQNTETMDESLNNQFIDAFKDTYIKELKNNCTVFFRVTCHSFLEHLLVRYRNITTPDLEANSKRMNKQIVSSLLIKKYFEQIDDCMQFSEDVNTQYTVEQVI